MCRPAWEAFGQGMVHDSEPHVSRFAATSLDPHREVQVVNLVFTTNSTGINDKAGKVYSYLRGPGNLVLKQRARRRGKHKFTFSKRLRSKVSLSQILTSNT